MSKINFFNPVYVIPVESKASKKVTRNAFVNTIVNLAESIFALGNGYQVARIEKKSTSPAVAVKFKRNFPLLTRICIRVAVLVAFVATSLLFPPLILVPIALFCVKLTYRLRHSFTVANEVPPSNDSKVQTNLGDSQLAMQICEEELLLLKEDGPLFKRFAGQIEQINQSKNSQAGTTLYAHLSAHQSYYAAMLDKEDDKANEKIYEVIESLGRLKSSIDFRIRGIVNVGNSCYINSSMQALLSIPEISQKLASLDESNFGGAQKGVVVAVKKFIAAYTLDLAPEDAMVSAAEEMQQALLNAGLILPAPDKREELESTIQALEAMGLGEAENNVLEAMKVSLAEMRAAGDNYLIKSQGDPLDLINELMDLIEMAIPMTLTCKAVSENPSVKPKVLKSQDPCLRIALKNTDGSPRLKDLVARHFAPTVEGEGRDPISFEIEGRKQHLPRWTEQLQIDGKPPAYLIVQVNRKIAADREMIRLDNRVDVKVGETFDFSTYFKGTPKSAMYEASAAILHKGDSHQGHYFAVRRDDEANWYECNDHVFKKLSKEDVENHLGSASIFILERKPNFSSEIVSLNVSV